jgi:hypothetical protein
MLPSRESQQLILNIRFPWSKFRPPDLTHRHHGLDTSSSSLLISHAWEPLNPTVSTSFRQPLHHKRFDRPSDRSCFTKPAGRTVLHHQISHPVNPVIRCFLTSPPVENVDIPRRISPNDRMFGEISTCLSHRQIRRPVNLQVLRRITVLVEPLRFEVVTLITGRTLLIKSSPRSPILFSPFQHLIREVFTPQTLSKFSPERSSS